MVCNGTHLNALSFCLCCQQVCQSLHLCEIKLARLQMHAENAEGHLNSSCQPQGRLSVTLTCVPGKVRRYWRNCQLRYGSQRKQFQILQQTPMTRKQHFLIFMVLDSCSRRV